MRFLRLDPDGMVERARTSAIPPPVPCLAASLRRGIVGFTIVSVAGFMPWAIAGGWLRHHGIGEAGMYLACAAIFILASAPLLAGLLAGPRDLKRFMAVFSSAFSAYAACWIVAWMTIHGNAGSIIGLACVTTVMGILLCRTFAATAVLLPVIGALFAGTLIGYYGGGFAEAWVADLATPSLLRIAVEKPPPSVWAMLSWGVCYGMGFGAGIGAAFHLCQAEHRRRLLLLPPSAAAHEPDADRRLPS